MRNMLALVTIALTALLQISLSGFPAGLKPDLLLIVAVFFALRRGGIFGFVAGAFSGFLVDCFSGSPLGLNVFIRAIAAAFVGRVNKRIDYSGLFGQMTIVFTISLAVNILYQFSAGLMGEGPAFFPALTGIILPASFYTGIVTPMIFFLLFHAGRLIGW